MKDGLAVSRPIADLWISTVAKAVCMSYVDFSDCNTHIYTKNVMLLLQSSENLFESNCNVDNNQSEVFGVYIHGMKSHFEDYYFLGNAGPFVALLTLKI